MAILGELEQRIMENLWRRSAPASVREVHESLLAERELAYTTVMTVLDRLAKKGLVSRERDGRAWIYRPATTRGNLVGDELLEVLDQAGPSLDEALGHFVAGLDEARLAALRTALG